MDTVEKKVLLTVSLEVKQMIADLAVTKKTIQDLRTEQKALDTTTEAGAKQYAVYDAEIRKTTATAKEQQKQIDNSIKSDNAKINSMEQLKAKLSLSTAEYNKMSDAERNAAKGKELNASINSITDDLKKLEKGIGDNRRNVGDYAGALQGLPGVFGKIAGGAETGASAMKAFNLTNPLGWIMLVVGAVTGWVNIMMKNADFAKGWQKLMAGISAVFESLSGYVIKGTMAISDFFKGVKDFPDFLDKVGTALKENLINRFTSIGIIGRAIAELFTGDWKAAVKDFANGAIQMTTGVQNGVEKMGAVVSDIADKTKKAMDWGALLVSNEKKLAKMNTDATESLAKLEVIIEEGQAKIGKLGTMGATREEREAAFKIVEGAERKKIALQIDIANQELKISKLKRDKEKADTLTNTRSVLDDVAQKNAALIKLHGELDLKLQEINMRKVKSDAQFLTESITYLQQSTKAEKAIQEEKLKQSDLSIEEKQKAIDKIHQIDNDSYAAQVKALVDFSKKNIDVDSLLIESDSNKALQMIKNFGLTKTAETELIKIVDTRKTALLESAKSEVQFNKDRANQIISDLSNELQLHQLYEKEINAGKQLSHQQEIDELVNTYNIEQKQLDEKHEADLISEDQYLNAQNLLDQKFKTDIAVSDAAFEDQKRNNKASQLANELTDLVGHFDLQNSLKHQQLDAQMEADLRVAKITEEEKKAIQEKYARESVSLDLETTKQKLENVLKYANAAMGILSGANDLNKAIEAGQLQDAEDANTKKIADLDARLKKGTISQKEHDKQVAASTAELDKKKAKITHDEAVREKELNVIKAIINTASAVVEALPNIPLSIAVGLAGALEIGTIIATPIPKAATGGLIVGKSHSQGGTLIEAEGGEMIINKKSSGMFGGLLGMLNGLGNGKTPNIPPEMYAALASMQNTPTSSTFHAQTPRFENDGNYSARKLNESTTLTKEDIREAMKEAVAGIKPVVTIEDIRKADKNYTTIQDGGNF